MILLQPSLAWCYIIINWGILWNTALLCSRSYWRFKSLNPWLCGWCLLNGKTFCSQTWYDDVPSWAGVSGRRLLFCFQGEGHSEVLHHPDITISTLFSKLPNHLHSHSVLSHQGQGLIKAKVRMMVQNFVECLTYLYFLYHWSLCNETRHVDT